MKEEVFENIKKGERVYCPVRNCGISVGINCSPWELSEAVRDGSLDIERKADWYQVWSGTGCNLYSTEPVKIFGNKDGIPVDYDIPYTDPNLDLSFRLFGGLVPYGSDIPGLLLGNPSPAQDFSDILYKAHRSNRELFPPKPIVVDDKPYEVSAVCACLMDECVSNLGEMKINLPLISK